jgi:hypothetical protein
MLILTRSNKIPTPGVDPEGGAPGVRPPKIGAIFLSAPPNLKSWIRPCTPLELYRKVTMNV